MCLSIFPDDFKARRESGEMICKGCGQCSSAQFCYTCLSIKLDQSFGSGLMADNVCDNVSDWSGTLISSVEYNFPVEGSFTKNVICCDIQMYSSSGWPKWDLGNLFSGKDIVWGPDEKDKKCTCLTSDLMIKGCTCGGK